ncbi:BatA domain-containing protein [Aporhodopirellula aestuarii]|uniref:BatA domain-containing protein n=1 Tax=Aporhodopirellula aestuarii TaxID=2950107 RepID=A0ABT0UAQ5_9BACT|nr:BatA domain-containing protein [Aporhodopirellula aestuarii]MCM2373892.1 BatA domain-containing protein [Aporhodopirellula aestuarii]
MSFLSATLLLGTLAAGIPVALHLLARQPPRRVIFPSVAFLQRQLTTQTSRLRVRRWWLLALRILALVAFAVVLARPHIDSAMSSTWTTVGLIALACLGLLALASVAFAKGLGRTMAWSLLVAALIAGGVAGVGAIGALATGNTPDFRIDRPLAIAIVIDNAPSSAWSVADDFQNDDASDENSGRASNPATLFLSTRPGTRLAVAMVRAGELIDRLPEGSRIAIVDRSTSPVGFSLDTAAARSRLSRITPIAFPASITERTASAVELVRTSDLSERHVVVISDMAAASWEPSLPAALARSPLAPSKHEDVPISIVNTHESVVISADLDANESVTAKNQGVTTPTINPWISLPQVADVAPPPGVAIPIRFDVGVWRGSGAETGSSPNRATKLSATVQMSLYERDPSLPVVRDGKLVLPALRSVDRASIELTGSAVNGRDEVLLTLPPLARGTYHAVIELIGDDRFMWDNWRFVTIDLPAPPDVLIVGDDRDETGVIAAAMTAPHAPDDPSASYRIQTVSYRDLAAVDWKPFEMVVLLDPPLRFSAQQNQIVGSNAGLSSAMLEQIAGVVARGGGLMFSLGPATEVIADGDATATIGSKASQTRWLIPPLVRSWRVPEPGTFWRVTSSSHPIFSSLMRPSSMPNWSDFRVRRYWQTDLEPTKVENETDETVTASPWEVLARYAVAADGGNTGLPAVMTRRMGDGRIAVTTTPLPALGSKTRTWNDLFSAADAWPAFMTVRGLAAYLAGIDRRNATIVVGQTAIVQPDPGAMTNSANSNNDETDNRLSPQAQSVELYAPGHDSGRTIPWTTPEITIRETETPGTYFMRGVELWSGFSANLSPAWSRGETTNYATLRAWLGEEKWSITREIESLSLTGSGGGSVAVSLHAPLTLLVVLVFLAEQLLSNRFYRAARDPGAT